MAYKAEKVKEVEGLGIVYRVDAPLDKQLQAFEKVGIHTLATPEEIAQIRLAGISDSWSRTNVAPVIIKGSNLILCRNSPLMNLGMASAAVRAHASGNYFETGKELYEALEAVAKSEEGIEPENRGALLVSQIGDFQLTPDMNEAKFLLGRYNQAYFEKFVKSGQIPFYNLTGSSKDRTTVNYLWFLSPQDGSYLPCWYRSLYYDSRAFGVLRTGEASAPKKGYTLTEIGKANSEIIPVVFTEAGIPALAGMVARNLNKGLLEKLRKQ